MHTYIYRIVPFLLFCFGLINANDLQNKDKKLSNSYLRINLIKSTLELASVDLIRGVQKQRVNNKINLIGRDNPPNPQ